MYWFGIEKSTDWTMESQNSPYKQRFGSLGGA
jgi:hypothetical protein